MHSKRYPFSQGPPSDCAFRWVLGARGTWVEYTSHHCRSNFVKLFVSKNCKILGKVKSSIFMCTTCRFILPRTNDEQLNFQRAQIVMIGNPNRERPSNREQFGFIRVANTYNATMHWSYGSPQQRPFTYNVILMMAPSLWAVITLGLFYCPNHKLSTPQFIRTWLNLVQGSCLVCINILVKIQHRPINPATAFAPNHFNMTNANQSNI